jgi:hypothetical protein
MLAAANKSIKIPKTTAMISSPLSMLVVEWRRSMRAPRVSFVAENEQCGRFEISDKIETVQVVRVLSTRSRPFMIQANAFLARVLRSTRDAEISPIQKVLLRLSNVSLVEPTSTERTPAYIFITRTASASLSPAMLQPVQNKKSQPIDLATLQRLIPLASGPGSEGRLSPGQLHTQILHLFRSINHLDSLHWCFEM